MVGIGDIIVSSLLPRQQSQSQGNSLPTPAIIAIVIGAIIVILLALALWRVLRTMRHIREASREGRRASAAVAQQVGSNPVTSFNRDGEASDPINVKIIGTNGQLAAAFAAAGWYRADEIDFVTSVRISVDSVFGRKYATAPVSNLYLYGRKEDYAFERPGKSVRERDHVRFWDTGAESDDGRTIWVGGATRDIKVEISKVTHLPTHKISPDVDAERETVIDSLVESGWVIDEGWETNFGKPTVQKNSLGDTYHTDGRRAVMTLADIFTFGPLTTQVRSPLGARIARSIAGALRWRLPKQGRERAQKRREAKTAQQRQQNASTTHTSAS
jgi:hypothetical protein